MKTNRLKHCADILCRMFCGWQLLDDYKTITRLGQGTLVIDVLTKTCSCNGKPVKLTMAEILGSWLSDDLKANGIPASMIRQAVLTVEFSTERHHGQISSPLQCSSVIQTADREYRSQYEETEKWRTNWLS